MRHNINISFSQRLRSNDRKRWKKSTKKKQNISSSIFAVFVLFLLQSVLFNACTEIEFNFVENETFFASPSKYRVLCVLNLSHPSKTIYFLLSFCFASNGFSTYSDVLVFHATEKKTKKKKRNETFPACKNDERQNRRPTNVGEW